MTATAAPTSSILICFLKLVKVWCKLWAYQSSAGEAWSCQSCVSHHVAGGRGGIGKEEDFVLSFVIENEAVQAELGAEGITVSGSVTRLPFRLYLPGGTVSVGERVFAIDDFAYLGRTREGVAQYRIDFGHMSSSKLSRRELVGSIILNGDVARNHAEWALCSVTSLVYPYDTKSFHLIQLK